MYLSILKEENKKSFLDFVCYVATSDGSIGKEEKEIIQAYCIEMQVATDFKKPELSFEKVIENICNCATENEKKIIIFEILGLAVADNRYDESEKELIYAAALKFNLNEVFINECEQIISEYISFQTKINSLILC